MAEENSDLEDGESVDDGGPGTPVKKEPLRRVEEDEKLPFTAHLEELRTRIIYCAATVFIIFAIFYSVSDYLFDYFREPMGGFELIAIAPTEAFFAYLKVSFYAALIVSVPMLLFHSWGVCFPRSFRVGEALYRVVCSSRVHFFRYWCIFLLFRRVTLRYTVSPLLRWERHHSTDNRQ